MVMGSTGLGWQVAVQVQKKVHGQALGWRHPVPEAVLVARYRASAASSSASFCDKTRAGDGRRGEC